MLNTQEEPSSSEHEEDPEVSFQPHQIPQPSPSQVGQPQPAAGIYMPHRDGPHMDWTVNDNLYHRFLKCCLKCENILECELTALPECQQCKKVIAWSRNCGMDQYVSWNLSSNELTLDNIWGKYEEYCKPQSNEVCTRFDLLMSFRQGNCSVDEWYNTIQVQVNLAKYPPEPAIILHRDIFWFFLKDEDFVSRTISDGSVDLDKFPASRVHQLAKKLESSKATTRHIKQVSGEPQATQINLLQHQRTKLPHHKYKKKRSHTKPRLGNNKPCRNDQYQGQIPYKNKEDHKPPTSNRLPPSNNFNRCSKCGDTTHHEGFTCPAKKYQCKACHKFGQFTSHCFQRKQHSQHKFRQSKAHQIQVDDLYNNSYPSGVSSSEDSFCLQVKIKRQPDGTQKIPRPTHLIMNIAYQMKQHHTRNQYLTARIRTGAEVNLMSVSVYRLIYHDQDLRKLTPCRLKIGTYTMDTIKIIGRFIIYLIHPDSKKLMGMIFYIASNKGSVLLSCNTSLTLGLIPSIPRLDYLPPRVSLITSSADHPRKNKSTTSNSKTRSNCLNIQSASRHPDHHNYSAQACHYSRPDYA